MVKPKSVEDDLHPDAMKRMEQALKAALKTPPKPHKDEPKKGDQKNASKAS